MINDLVGILLDNGNDPAEVAGELAGLADDVGNMSVL
jgi:hypothetical protein